VVVLDGGVSFVLGEGWWCGGFKWWCVTRVRGGVVVWSRDQYLLGIYLSFTRDPFGIFTFCSESTSRDPFGIYSGSTRDLLVNY